MFIENNDSRTPLERIDGELLKQIRDDAVFDADDRSNRYRRDTDPRSSGYRTPPTRGGREDRRDCGCDITTGASPVSNGRGSNCGCGQDTRDTRGKGCADYSGESCACPDCDNGYRCGGHGLFGRPLAMVYSPVQEFCRLYELDKALEKGTLFSDLDLPLTAVQNNTKGGCCRG